MCVVNLYKERFDVYIGRPDIFGNPFEIGKDGNRAEVIQKFTAYFLRRVETDTAFRNAVLQLRGKRLGCFCKPAACHGDVIVAWLEKQAQGNIQK